MMNDDLSDLGSYVIVGCSSPHAPSVKHNKIATVAARQLLQLALIIRDTFITLTVERFLTLRGDRMVLRIRLVFA